MDAWLVRLDEDEPLYVYELAPFPVLVKHPEDAASFTNAAARRAMRVFDGQKVTIVRRFEELRNA